MRYIALLRTATGQIRFLVGGVKFSPEFPDAQIFETVAKARKAAKATGLFALEIHNADHYGVDQDAAFRNHPSWVANS